MNECLTFAELAQFATIVQFEMTYSDASRIVLEKAGKVWTWLRHAEDLWCILGAGGQPT